MASVWHLLGRVERAVALIYSFSEVESYEGRGALVIIGTHSYSWMRLAEKRGKTMEEGNVQEQKNPLAQYSVPQLLRLLTQFSCTKDVEQELVRRFGGRTVTIPVCLLAEVQTNTVATAESRHYL